MLGCIITNELMTHMRHLTLSLLLVQFVSAFGSISMLHAQCLNHAMAVSVQRTCKCTRETVYAGGCAGTTDQTQSCAFLSYYACGTDGGVECDVAYAETQSGGCQEYALTRNAKPRMFNPVASVDVNTHVVPWSDQCASPEIISNWLETEREKRDRVQLADMK